MSALHRVAWPYANVRIIDPATGTTTVVGLVKDQPVPSIADPEDVKRLVTKGALVPFDPVAAPAPAPEPAAEAKPAKATGKRRDDSE